MQLIRREHAHSNLYCAISGKAVDKKDGGIKAKTFVCRWSQEVPNEPPILGPELKAVWHAYGAIIQVEVGDLDIGGCVEGVDMPGWVGIEVKGSGMTCSRVRETTRSVLDLSGKF